MMERLTYQDVNLTDNEKRKQIISYYNDGNYTAALQLLQDESLDGKHITAQLLNDITDKIVALQTNLDPSFKDELIITSPQPPANIKQNDVWFEQYKPYYWQDVNKLQYTFSTINVKGYTWAEVNKGGW